MNRKHPTIKSGDRFGKWLVIERDQTRRQEAFLCYCDCGAEVVVLAASLRRGRSTQCHSCAFVTHGQTRGYRFSAEYVAWSSMLSRCLNPKVSSYLRYGGRGVSVCSQWIGKGGFERFFGHVGTRPTAKHSLDRYPNKNGNYEPGNVRWATQVEQSRNTRRNKFLTFQGVSRCVSEWAELLKVHPGRLHNRLSRGWSAERALNTPYVSAEKSR
jgi:hypothetical protein